MRQVLDHLYSVCNDYCNTIDNKPRPFHSVAPSRAVHVSLKDTEQLHSIIPGFLHLSLVLTDLELLRLVISFSTTIHEIITYLKAVGHDCSRASSVYNFLITLPVINVAPNERSFSKMKIVKNYLRNALKNETCFYLM